MLSRHICAEEGVGEREVNSERKQVRSMVAAPSSQGREPPLPLGLLRLFFLGSLLLSQGT